MKSSLPHWRYLYCCLAQFAFILSIQFISSCPSNHPTYNYYYFQSVLTTNNIQPDFTTIFHPGSFQFTTPNMISYLFLRSNSKLLPIIFSFRTFQIFIYITYLITISIDAISYLRTNLSNFDRFSHKNLLQFICFFIRNQQILLWHWITQR